MKFILPRFLLSLAFVGLANCLSIRAEEVAIQVDTKNPGAAIPSGFTGLSFEVAQLLPNENGVHYFRPDNKPLITLFKTLGIKNLRIGGNTSDRDVRQLPAEADLDSLFTFAKAADVKVIYCLRLHNGDPQVDAQTVKYIMARYAEQMEAFSIGQEPSAYPRMTNATRAAEGMGAEFEKYSYADYSRDWKVFADAIIAAVPDVKFCGPSVHNNGAWAVDFMTDFGESNHVVLVTEHLYAGGAGGKVPTPEIGIDRMLAAANSEVTNPFPKGYQKLYNSFVPACVSNGLPYRLEEVNNYFNGGALHVSETFASALWGIDFMHWWAEHGAAGLNFHTGDKVAAGASLQPSKYTAYFSTTNGYLIRPLGYGIKAFELGGHGTNLPVTLTSNPADLNLTAYASAAGGGNLYLTVINKEHGTNARDAVITVSLNDTNYKYGEAVFLTAPGDDVAATSGVTIGGAPILNDGSWNGTWTELGKPALDGLRAGKFRLKVPAATALMLVCMRANYAESEVGTFQLPDPLVMQNGKRVRNNHDWINSRRPQILNIYQQHIYGVSPPPPKLSARIVESDAHALGGTAVRKQIVLEFSSPQSTNHVVFHVLLYTPAGAKKPVPTFLSLSFSGTYTVIDDPSVIVNPVWNRTKNFWAMPKEVARGSSHSWNIPETLARGYGIAIVDYNDIEPDAADGSGWKYGIRSLYSKPDGSRAPNEWGAISTWSWGASRILDYLQTDRDIDPHRIIMLGHSRLGKTALWTGAQDPRFAMVIASCSGEMGAALSRRDYGETVTTMSKSFPYQFCPNFVTYSNRISQMPVDSHMLVSLIAPRPLYLNTGSEDRWGDPRGEFEAAIAATPVYALFGELSVVKDLPPEKSILTSAVLESLPQPPLDVPVMRDIGFQTHTGKHDITREDWERFLDFADLHFYGKPPHQYAAGGTNPPR